MASRQKTRSDETKQAILTAAGELFAARGYDAVTMREIANAAGCSHTTIYIYFNDKEALLHQLSMPPLQALQREMEAALSYETLSAGERLKQMSRVFIHFCLTNRNLYTVLFMAKAGRVDVDQPDLAVGQLRNHLFGLLRQAVRGCLPPGRTDDQILAYARVHFFALHGIISLYTGSAEPLDALMARLSPTFDLALEVLLTGFQHTANGGAAAQ